MKKRLAIWIAYRLPKWVVYWATVRLGAYASTGPWASEDTTNLTVLKALERWGKYYV